MKINPIQFNFVQNRPQNMMYCPLYKNDGLQTDTVSFSGLFEKEKTQEPAKTLKDLVPKHKGIIYKKVYDENGNVVKKVPVEVDIVKNDDTEFCFEIDGKLVGGVDLSCFRKKNNDNCGDLYRNYKREGIKGDRIIAHYIFNCKEEEYGGVGHLADLVEVAACKELGIEPNVVSFSAPTAAPLHYIRGKRFVPFKKYNLYYIFHYHGKNPNDMVKEIIEDTTKGQNFNTSKIQHCFLTYMPKEMINQLEKELEEHPIF